MESIRPKITAKTEEKKQVAAPKQKEEEKK